MELSTAKYVSVTSGRVLFGLSVMTKPYSNIPEWNHFDVMKSLRPRLTGGVVHRHRRFTRDKGGGSHRASRPQIIGHSFDKIFNVCDESFSIPSSELSSIVMALYFSTEQIGEAEVNAANRPNFHRSESVANANGNFILSATRQRFIRIQYGRRDGEVVAALKPRFSGSFMSSFAMLHVKLRTSPLSSHFVRILDYVKCRFSGSGGFEKVLSEYSQSQGDRTDANAERKAVFSRKRTLSDIDRGGFSRVSSGESADLADNTIHLLTDSFVGAQIPCGHWLFWPTFAVTLKDSDLAHSLSLKHQLHSQLEHAASVSQHPIHLCGSLLFEAHLVNNAAAQNTLQSAAAQVESMTDLGLYFQLAVRQREGVHAGKREDPLPAPVDLRKMLVHSPLHSPAVMDVSVQLVLYPEQSPLFHQGAVICLKHSSQFFIGLPENNCFEFSGSQRPFVLYNRMVHVRTRVETSFDVLSEVESELNEPLTLAQTRAHNRHRTSNKKRKVKEQIITNGAAMCSAALTLKTLGDEGQVFYVRIEKELEELEQFPSGAVQSSSYSSLISRVVKLSDLTNNGTVLPSTGKEENIFCNLYICAIGSQHVTSVYIEGYWQRRSPPFMIRGNALLRNVSINWNNRIMRRRSGRMDQYASASEISHNLNRSLGPLSFNQTLCQIKSFHSLCSCRPVACVCISPSLADLPNMEKPGSRTSSQAQWKPSDTLHYIVLVPIKGDTIRCQEPGDTLQRGRCKVRVPVFVSTVGLCEYTDRSVQVKPTDWSFLEQTTVLVSCEKKRVMRVFKMKEREGKQRPKRWRTVFIAQDAEDGSPTGAVMGLPERTVVLREKYNV
ncbi:hypothetical protein F2P81_005531 [Scophthalmus maximus]|uniref:Uncharacterized protein n=2 Tax=Scophthalmus maximus TaxID=52904 RepID=A0A6A4TAT2_SCOMX|nr:hypothetical protein F2P81_005531 [Scophthalmus maximus]